MNILALVPVQTLLPLSPIHDGDITARAIARAGSEVLLNFVVCPQESSLLLEFPTHNSQVSIAKVFKDWASGQQHRWCTGAANAHPLAPSGSEVRGGAPPNLRLRKPAGDADAK